MIGVVLLYCEIAPQMTTRARRAEEEQQRVEDLAADVVEVDVDALRAVLREGGLHVLGLVIDGGIEAQVLDDVVAFLGSAGDADGAAALDLGDLAGDGADGAGGARKDDGLARLGLTDIQQAEVGRQSGHAEGTQVDGQRGQADVDLHDALAPSIKAYSWTPKMPVTCRRRRSRGSWKRPPGRPPAPA